MESIHGHEVLNMMIESGEQYTHASLEAAIKARFGEQARFHTCSAEGMTAGELVAFLAAKGKFIPSEEGQVKAAKVFISSIKNSLPSTRKTNLLRRQIFCRRCISVTANFTCIG